jgi:type II secretory pathway predicted ATPase ExeA
MDALPQPRGTEPMEMPPARVYLDFYQLTEAPFAITPDPEFLFTAGSHQQAIEKITYAIGSHMGFILLTGEVGTGKTTVCRTLLDRLSNKAETVYIINPSVSGHELLTGILEDAHIVFATDASKKTLIDHLYRHLLSLEASRSFVVIIDDAQTMTAETLEELRLLSNLETDKQKLIQVVLSGQPELIDLLGSNRLRQLNQRIAVHCRLTALSAAETGAYISQRLFVAGNQGQVRFSADATRLVHKTAGGIPRLINKICDYALTAGYVKDAPIIQASHVRLALAELETLNSGSAPKTGRRFGHGTAAMAIILLAVLAGFMLMFHSGIVSRRPSITDTPMADDRSRITTLPPGPSSPAPLQPAPSSTMAMKPLSTANQEIPAAKPGKEEMVSMDQSAKATALTEDRQNPPEIPHPAPYALQLGSFGTRENTLQSVSKYLEKGIPAHFQAVNAGQWYRVMAGKFENLTMARQYQQAHGLTKALIIKAPLTVKVMPGHPNVAVTDIPDFLSQIGYGCLMETGPTGDNEFYSGLFASVQDASLAAKKINASGRFLAQVVER